MTVRRSRLAAARYALFYCCIAIGLQGDSVAFGEERSPASSPAARTLTILPDEWIGALDDAASRGEIIHPADRTLPPVHSRRGRPHPIAGGSSIPWVRDDDIYLYTDRNRVLTANFSNGALFSLMSEATNALMVEYGDKFDFVGFFLSFLPHHQIGSAFYLGVENDVAGLGNELFNDRDKFGLAGENINGFVMMWREASWTAFASELGDVTQLVMGQEFEHRFGVFLQPFLDGRIVQGQDGPCGRSSHWNHRVDGQGSGMEIREWVGAGPLQHDDEFCTSFFAPFLCYNSDVGFSNDGLGGVYSLPDLYLMGYVSPEEMDTLSSELRYLNDSTACLSPYNGVVSTWDSNDIIAANGPRLPDETGAQKHFNTAWIMLHLPGEPPTAAQIENAVGILNKWTDTYQWSTLGRGTMNNTLQRPFTMSLPNSAPILVSPDDTPTFIIQTEDRNSTPDVKSGLLHYSIDDGPFQTSDLVPLGNGAFEATLPAIQCGNRLRFYVSLASLEGDIVTLPHNAPEAFRAATAAESIVLADDFEANLGWTVDASGNLQGGLWERGIPIGTGDYGDPTTDYDGSGRCFLTENEPGNSDVDVGISTLESPVFDLSAISEVKDVHVVYARWFSNSITDGLRDDPFVVQVSGDDGGTWADLEIVGPTAADPNPQVDGGWHLSRIRLAQTLPDTESLRIRFRASDMGGSSVVEAGIDAFALIECPIPPDCGDGIRNQGEIRIDCGGPCEPCDCLADLTCDDAAFCNGSESCDAFGHCQPGTDACPGQFCNESADVCFECLIANDCDDGVACTVDSCTLNACAHTPDDDLCDNSLFCFPQTCDPNAGCLEAPERCAGRQCDEVGRTCVGPAIFECQLTESVVPPGSEVELDVFVSNVLDLNAYQVGIEIEPVSGSGDVSIECPTDLSVDSNRPDYVFTDAAVTSIGWDCQSDVILNEWFGGGTADVGFQPRYAATFVLTVSPDATNTSSFNIGLSPSPTSAMFEPQEEPIAFTVALPCRLTIGNCETTDFGDVNRDGIVDLLDIFCVLDGVQGTFKFCPFERVDIAPCDGDGVIDISDIFAVLDAFQSLPTSCPDPCIDG